MESARGTHRREYDLISRAAVPPVVSVLMSVCSSVRIGAYRAPASCV